MDGWSIYRIVYITASCSVALSLLVYGLVQHSRGKDWLGGKPSSSIGCTIPLAFCFGSALLRCAPGKLEPLTPGLLRTTVVVYSSIAMFSVFWYVLSCFAQWFRYRKDRPWLRDKTNSEFVVFLLLFSCSGLTDLLDKLPE